MTRAQLTPEQIADLEGKLSHVLVDLTATEGEVDIESEFEKVMFSKTEPSEDTYAEIRELSKRFGPKLIELLGFPPVAGKCKVHVQEKGMRAAVDIEPATGGGLPVTVEQVHQILKEQKIVYGIDEEAIGKAVESGRTTGVCGYCVARGTPMNPGRDGWIEPMEQGKPPARMDIPKGESYIPVSNIETVARGQKIATLIAPVPGTAGKDVFGWEIPAPAGKPVVPEAGDNVSFDAHAGYFYAKSPGRVMIDGNAIDIEKMMAFSKDIDISVGHVSFPGELLVHGWVRSGLSVQAEKDIVIEGGVEAALVKSADGGIYVAKGIQGSGLAMVQAAWDISAKFIEQATVMAGGVLKTQNAVRSELAAGEAVIVTEGKGVVIGGKIYAGDRVEVRELGGGTGESTVVQLGITPENLAALSKLKTRLQASQKALRDAENALAHVGLTADALQAQAMTEEGRQLLKLAKTIIVLHSRLRKIQDEETAFVESMKNRTNGVLDARGRVYPGVRILIGHAVYYVVEPMSCVRFKYDADQRRIKAIPLI